MRITVKDLSFRYPDAEDKALDNIARAASRPCAERRAAEKARCCVCSSPVYSRTGSCRGRYSPR